jgi:hypothetical protein
MCYNRQTKVSANKIPSSQTWTIIEAICDALSHIHNVFWIKNWHDDPIASFEDMIGLVILNGFGEVEEDILDIIDLKFPHEV